MAKTSVIKIGQTFRRQLSLSYVENGKPVDLTGCEAYCQMRDVPGGQLKATAVCTIDVSMGKINATFSAADTAMLEEGEYGYDIWLISEGDKVPLYTERVSVIDRYTDNMS